VNNGTFRKEFSEYETSNEINFLKKLIDNKSEGINQKATTVTIQNNLRPIDVRKNSIILKIINF